MEIYYDPIFLSSLFPIGRENKILNSYNCIFLSTLTATSQGLSSPEKNIITGHSVTFLSQ